MRLFRIAFSLFLLAGLITEVRSDVRGYPLEAGQGVRYRYNAALKIEVDLTSISDDVYITKQNYKILSKTIKKVFLQKPQMFAVLYWGLKSYPCIEARQFENCRTLQSKLIRRLHKLELRYPHRVAELANSDSFYRVEFNKDFIFRELTWGFGFIFKEQTKIIKRPGKENKKYQAKKFLYANTKQKGVLFLESFYDLSFITIRKYIVIWQRRKKELKGVEFKEIELTYKPGKMNCATAEVKSKFAENLLLCKENNRGFLLYYQGKRPELKITDL